MTKILNEQEEKIKSLNKKLKDEEENGGGGEGGSPKKKGLMKELSDQLLKMSEYHTFYESLNLQIEREKQLRQEVELKMTKMESIKEKLVSDTNLI